jgi:drug/metabolite transporter (DMT)-like permease
MKSDLKLLFCLIIVGLVWGTTYLGISIAIETIPPWYSTTIRNFLAALIVLCYLVYNKELYWIGWQSFGYQTIASVLMLVFANGFTTIAEQTLPSGLTSILSAFNPVVVFLLSIIFGLQKPTLRGFVGVAVGFIGMLFIFKDGLGDILNPNYKTGVIFLSIAILSWASGTIFTKKIGQSKNSIAVNIFYQFSIAAAIQIVLANIFYDNSNFQNWSSRSVFAVCYLAVFGSVIALFAYQYALKKVSPIQVSILTYVNTIIAVFLGWLIKEEVIKNNFVIATLLIILGVFIINYKRKIKLK